MSDRKINSSIMIEASSRIRFPEPGKLHNLGRIEWASLLEFSANTSKHCLLPATFVNHNYLSPTSLLTAVSSPKTSDLTNHHCISNFSQISSQSHLTCSWMMLSFYRIKSLIVHNSELLPTQSPRNYIRDTQCHNCQ